MQLMVSTTWILIGFTDSITSAFRNGLFIEYLRSFLDYKEKIPENYDGEDPGDHIETLEFRDVSFAYKDEKVIEHLNMKFEDGQTYALVGHNGAGKTTIIKLLLRFYDPTEGAIFLNGKDIRTYNLRKYRNLFATAFQDNRIFSMSVTDNVLMKEGKGDESDKEVAKAALELSGVYELNRAMEEAAYGKTVFYISHRLSTTRNADRIIMLEKGSIIEESTHEELLALNGKYAQM